MGTDSYISGDGVYIYMRDPGTEVIKKNRKRHVKDGCPKSERGKPKYKDGVKIDEIPYIGADFAEGIDYTSYYVGSGEAKP